MTPDAIRDAIAPVLKYVYGDSASTDGLVEHLVRKLALGEFDDRGRQHEMMLRCWDWFPGGDTAEAVAAKIEEALRSAEVSA